MKIADGRFELPTFGIWTQRATELLQSAIDIYKNTNSSTFRTKAPLSARKEIMKNLWNIKGSHLMVVKHHQNRHKIHRRCTFIHSIHNWKYLKHRPLFTSISVRTGLLFWILYYRSHFMVVNLQLKLNFIYVFMFFSNFFSESITKCCI